MCAGAPSATGESGLQYVAARLLGRQHRALNARDDIVISNLQANVVWCIQESDRVNEYE